MRDHVGQEAGHDDHVEIDIPETLTLEEIESVVGEEEMAHLPKTVHRIDDERLHQLGWA